MIGMLDITATEATVLVQVARGHLVHFDKAPIGWFPPYTAPQGPCWLWMSGRGNLLGVATWEQPAIEALQRLGLLTAATHGGLSYDVMPTRDGAAMLNWLDDDGWYPWGSSPDRWAEGKTW